MANEERNKISVEIEGVEKSLNLLFKLQESMAATAIDAAKFVTSLNTVNTILTALAGASLKNVTAEIGSLGKAFSKFGQQFDTKGIKTLIGTNAVTQLATKLQTLAVSVRGLPGSSAALTVIANGLKELSSVINDKNFAVAGPSLRKVATALVFLSEKTKTLAVNKDAITGLLSLVGVFKAFKDIRGEASIGPALQSIAVGIGSLNKEFGKATFILDPANAASIEGLGKALQQFGKAFTGFSKNFSGDEISKNMHLIITLIGELKDQFASFENIDKFSVSISSLSEGLSSLSKAFRSLTIGKNIAALEDNSKILIKFINDLATIDAAPIIAKLQPLSDVIKNLADAGRAIGALKGIDNVKAKITQFGIELEKSKKQVSIWERVTRAAISGIASGVSAEFKKAAQAVTAYAISFVTSPIKKFFSAILQVSGAIIKIPFSIVTAAAKGFLYVIQSLLRVIAAILSPITNLTNIFGKFFGQAKTANKTTTDLSDSFEQLDTKVRRVEPTFDRFGNEVVKLAPSAKILGVNLGNVGKAINTISSKAINTLSSSLRNATKNSSDFFIGFLGMDRILQIVSRSIQQVTRLLGALGRTIFDSYSETENLKASLAAFQAIELVDLGQFETIPEALEQANDQANELYKKFQQIAKDSPFETSALVETFNTLQTFKFDSKSAEALTRILVDFGATVGVSNAELADFALIFGQIRASGKLLGQDMKQLQTRGLNVGEALAKAWERWHGEVITNNEAIEKAQEGLINVDDVIVALAESMNTSFGGNAQRMNNTLTALRSTIDDIRKTLLVDLFGKAIESAKPFLNILLEIIQSEKAAAVIEKLSIVIERNLVTALNVAGKAIKVAIFLWNTIPVPFKEAIKQIALFAAAMAGITIVVGTLSVAATTIGFALSFIINPISLVAGAITGLVLVIRRNIDIVTSTFRTLQTNAIAIFNSIYKTISDFASKTLSRISEFTNKFASNFAETLKSMQSFGYNVIRQFASGIIAALSLVVSAIRRLGSILAYWLAPGSPPRILPDIDKWGTAAANEFLGGFGVADFSLISDFSSVLKNLLKSVDLEDVDTTGIVKAFSTSLSELSTTGDVDLSDAFEQITATVPTASDEVKNLLQLYLQLSQQTDELNKSTEKYSSAINSLEGELADLEDASLGQTEERQIQRLENLSKSNFVSEGQRQKALIEINKIKAQQELRNLKKEESGRQNAVETTKEQIDLIKERIDLANQFAQEEAAAIIQPEDVDSDAAAKAKKAKKEKEEELDSIADAIGGSISDIEQALSNVSLDLPELNIDGITSKFNQLSDDVNDTFTKIRIKILVFIQDVRATLTTLGNWKDEVVRIFQLVVDAAQNVEGIDIKSAILDIDISSVDSTATSLGTIAGTIGNILERIYTNLLTQFTKINNISSEVRSEGGSSDIFGAILGFDSSNTDASIGAIIGNIGLAFDNLVTGIKDKYTTFTGLLEADSSLTIQDALSKTLFGVDLSGAVELAKQNISNAITDIINYIPSQISSISTLTQVGMSPIDAILFSVFSISPSTTFEIINQLKTLIEPIKTSIQDFIKNLFPASEGGQESFLSTYLALFDMGELGDAIKTFIDALGNFAKGVAPIVAAIAGIIAGLLAAIAPEIPGILAGILNSISAVLNFLGDTLNTLFDIFTGKVGLFEGVKTIFMSFVNNILAFFGGIDQIARHIIDIIGNVATLIGGLTGIDVSGFFNIFDKIRPILEFIVSNVLLGGVGKLVGWLGKLFKSGASGGGFISFLTKLTEKLRGMLGPIAEGVIGLVTRIANYFRGVVEIFRSMADDIAFFVNRPIDAFRTASDEIAGVLSKASFGGISSFFQNMLANARQFVDDIAMWFGTISTRITNALSNINFGGLTNLFQTTVTNVRQFVDDVILWIKNIPTAIADIFSSFGIGPIIKQFADDALMWIETIPTAIGDIFSSFGIGPIIKQFVDDALLWIKNIPTTIADIFSSFEIGPIVKQFADDALLWIQTLPTKISEIFGSFGLTLGETFKTNLFEFLGNLVTSSTKFIDDIIALFASIPTKIKNVFASFKKTGANDDALQVTFEDTPLTEALAGLSSAFDELFLLVTGTSDKVKFFKDEIISLGTTIIEYFSTDTIAKISKLILETMALAKTEVGQVAIGFFDEVRESLNNLLTFFREFKLPNIFESFEIPESVKAVLRFAGIDVGETIATAASDELTNIDISPPTIDSTKWSTVGTDGGLNIATGIEDGFNSEINDPGFFENAKNRLTSAWANMWDSHSPSKVAADLMGLPIAEGVAQGISDGFSGINFQSIFTAMYDIITLSTINFLNLYKANFAAFVTYFLIALDIFVTKVKVIYDETYKAITLLTMNFANLYKTNFTTFTIVQLAALGIFVKNVVNKYQNMSDQVIIIVDSMFTLIISAAQTFKIAFIEIATQTIAGFLKEFEGLGEKAVGLINIAIETIRNSYNDQNEPAFIAGKTIGDAIGRGIIVGIDDKISGVLNTIRNMISQAIAAAKAALDSNSPSKVTAKQIGEPFGEGIGVGIEKSFTAVNSLVANKLSSLGSMNTTIPQIKQAGQEAFSTNSPYIFGQNGTQNPNLQRSIQTANNTTVVNNFSKEYHIHMTVTPERATQVQRNFNVAEFLSI